MYNPLASYEENLARGPASEWNRGGVFPRISFCGRPQYSIFDIPLNLPLGIPAGPLLSAAFVQVALQSGFAMPVYKTVRSRAWPSHPWPNVLRLASDGNGPPSVAEGHDIQIHTTMDDASQRPRVTVVPLHMRDVQSPEVAKHLSITNAFGVPSMSAEGWSSDFQSLPDSAFSQGRCTVLSFQGSRAPEGRWQDFLDDTAHTARLAARCIKRRQGRVLEMNVSCPNEAGAPIYSDLRALEETLRAAALGLEEHPELKLIVKLGVVPPQAVLRTVELVAHYAHGLSAINTVSATIVNPQGERALGSGAEHGGVCGTAIRAQALHTIKTFQQARRALGLDRKEFALVGVGGCSTPDDLDMFIEAGADVVHVATAAMWNLQFAAECAKKLNVEFSSEVGSK